MPESLFLINCRNLNPIFMEHLRWPLLKTEMELKEKLEVILFFLNQSFKVKRRKPSAKQRNRNALGKTMVEK